MLVILSQKIDSESSSSDELFNTYHYPSRYRNQLHEGDTFIYYQGNPFSKEQRYYFGVGTVGTIMSTDGENYYAKLINCQRFEKDVPICLLDGGYVEQLGYETVRNSPVPPWQSSVRPLSQQAFDYIIGVAVLQQEPEKIPSVDELKEKLKNSVRRFYRDDDPNAILEIESIASAIAQVLNIVEKISEISAPAAVYEQTQPVSDKVRKLIEYCETTRMTYSYKPVLILAFMKCADKNGHLKINKAVQFIRDYYNERRKQGMIVEKKKSLYQNTDISDEQIRSNLLSNPIKVLAESDFFFFNPETQELSMSPEIWSAIGRSEKKVIGKI